MTNLKNRAGAILVLAAFLMVMALSMFVVVVDLSRIFLQKNELQTAVDAAALAGVIELSRDTALVDDSAISFGMKNGVLKLAPTIPGGGVKCGVWNDATRIFTASSGCALTDNAVEVSGSAPAQASMASFMSLAGLQVATKATAWIAFVNGAKCVKPFGIPYTSLTYALRPDRANPDPYPLRALDDGDLYRLKTYPRDSLRFKLKVDNSGEANGPGNFGALDLDGSKGGGGSDYKEDIIGCEKRLLSIGDVIYTEPGNKVGPTIQGVTGLCTTSPHTMVGNECRRNAVDMGVPVLAPLWYSPTPVKGNAPVTIIQIGSFMLDSLEGASIIGHFVGFATGGSIGAIKTTITRPVLVK